MEETIFGNLCLRDVGQRADDPEDLAIGTDDRPRLEVEPEIMGIRRAHTKIEMDLAASLFQHGVKRGAIPIAVGRMDNAEPADRRPVQRADLETETVLAFGADIDLVADDIPIEHQFIGTRQRQRLALGFRRLAGRQ